MRIISLIAAIGILAVCSVVGCKKSDDAPKPSEINGVVVDIPKLNNAFADAKPELKATVTEVSLNLRYQKYEDALMALDKLANDPNVIEAQKKVVNELIDQVKKLATAAPAAAAPAQ